MTCGCICFPPLYTQYTHHPRGRSRVELLLRATLVKKVSLEMFYLFIGTNFWLRRFFDRQVSLSLTDSSIGFILDCTQLLQRLCNVCGHLFVSVSFTTIISVSC